MVRVLDLKTKELAVIAIAVTARCDGFIAFQTKATIRGGASEEELLETLDMSVYMGDGPLMVYVAEALAVFDQFS